MNDIVNFELPKYSLEIDEEGYPLFSGLRTDDEDLLREYFDNLHQLNPENANSAWLSDCGGKRVLVESFSTPLVAQRIEDIGPSAATWVFPAGRSLRVEHSALRVDPFNRIHALVGEKEIPATVRRHAQVEFLLNFDGVERIRSFYPSDEGSRERASCDFWEQRYQDSQTDWDLGVPAPGFVENEQSIVQHLGAGKLGPIVLLGAGRGNDAEFFEKKGPQNIVAVDFAPSAAEAFKKHYPDSKVKFVVADAFQYLEERKSKLGAVIEHTFFCAIAPAYRERYWDAVYSSLKSGGLLIGLFWMRPRPNGPPYGLSQWELRERVRDRFLIKEWRRVKSSPGARAGQEFFVILQKA